MIELCEQNQPAHLSGSKGIVAFTRMLEADSPESAMRIACTKLLQTYKFATVPTPLNKILNILGASIRYTAPDSVTNEIASTRYSDKKVTIVINRNKLQTNWRRTRFSIAHEIGHIILYKYLQHAELIDSLDKDEASYRQLERICDVAASELLMPRWKLREAVNTYGLTPSGLKNLLELFGVSQEALSRAIAELVPSGAVIRWRHHARHNREEQVLRVVSSYPYIPAMMRPWLPKGCTMEHINPPIVDATFQEKKMITSDALIVKLNKKHWECKAASTFFPSETAIQEQLYKHTDAGIQQEIFLFLFHKHAVESSLFWGQQH